MGFKRTSEGRVFFQTNDEPAGAVKKADFRSISQNSNAAQATQFQILSLLKALNEKLKDSQAERRKMKTELESYRKAVEGLEGKAERSERAYLDLEQKLGKPDKNAAVRAERAEKLAEDLMQELSETRKLILELEDKTDKADKGVMTLQRQMGQTRALGEEVARRQDNYDALVGRLEAAENKQEDLAEQLEKAATEQARILRQIEKIADDRARFMRKIERIEETVIQTRDALTARAMVLLTDKGAGARLEGQDLADPVTPSVVEQVMAPAERRQEKERTGMSFLFQAGIAAAVLTAGVLGGWAVSKIQETRFAALEDFDASHTAEDIYKDSEADSRDENLIAPETSGDVSVADSAKTESQETAGPLPAVEGDENVTENVEPPSGTETAAPTSEDLDQPSNKASLPSKDLSKADDLGTVDLKDEKKVMEMLETDPDKVAAELNKLEPSTSAAPHAPVDIIPKAEKEPIKTASIEPAQAVLQPPVTPVKPGSAPAVSENELRKMIQPDSSLPLEIKPLEEKAYAGVPEAQHDLAAYYTSGESGVQQDYKRAAFWFRQAADNGIANARYNLGVLYHQGLGVKPDVKEAIKWYKSAAALGHPEAQYNLGIAYIEGIGVPYDPQSAASNFESAARQNITEAAYNLGLIYENGLLGKAEPDKALRWYKTAADQGSPEAKEALAQLAKTLNIKVEDINRIADTVQ